MTVRNYGGGVVYNLAYDAENRLTGVSGAVSASFTYDGDGNRVKGTVGGVTTAYIGNYFEWISSTSTMKRYYYAGGTRIAMREGSTLSWLLGDHLGSTSITANTSGVPTGEVRYRPWGEDRYTWGTTPTSYRYTGQRSEMGSIGLYFYDARFYDPWLGRFSSPDSTIPEASQGMQAWDRYAYVNNSPLLYTDPTGHDLEQIVFNKTGKLPQTRQPPPQLKRNRIVTPAVTPKAPYRPTSTPTAPLDFNPAIPIYPTVFPVPTSITPPTIMTDNEPNVPTWILGIGFLDPAGSAAGGAELLLFPDGTIAIFDYTGTGAAVGTASGTTYIGIVNADQPEDYVGLSIATDFTAALGIGGHGGYFHNADDTIGGVTLGPAGGYGFSISTMYNNYDLVWRWNPFR